MQATPVFYMQMLFSVTELGQRHMKVSILTIVLQKLYLGPPKMGRVATDLQFRGIFP